MEKNWKTVLFEEHDLKSIGLFFKKQFQGLGQYGTMGFFHWKLIQNVFGKGFLNLVKDQGIIAATTSITPKIVFIHGQEVKCAEIGDTFTDEKYQRQGIFSLLVNKSREIAINEGHNYIYGTPNTASLAGYEKNCHFKPVISSCIQLSAIHLNIELKLRKFLPWFLASTTALMYRLLIYFRLNFQALFLKEKDIVFTKIEELPADWQQFWFEAKDSYDYIMARDQNSFTWRFINNPNKYEIYLVKKNNKTVGYVVFRLVAGVSHKDLFVADYLTLPGYEKFLSKLINQKVLEGVVEGVANVYCWSISDRDFTALLTSLGFKSKGKIPLICYQNEIVEKLETCKKWHFTFSDTDNV